MVTAVRVSQVIGNPTHTGYILNPGFNQLAVGLKVDMAFQEYPAVMNAHVDVAFINTNISVKNAVNVLSNGKVGDAGCHRNM